VASKTQARKEVTMDVTKPDSPKDDSRRSFLKAAAAGAPLAAVAAATGTTAQAGPADPVNETRLQDTVHTRTYYEAARF
jgi:hypothetical protein